MRVMRESEFTLSTIHRNLILRHYKRVRGFWCDRTKWYWTKWHGQNDTDN